MTRLHPFVGAALVALSLSLPARAEGPTADTVVATVNGVDITLGQMVSVRETLPPKYLSLPDDVLFNGILDQIVQQTVLAQNAEADLTLRQKLELEAQKRGFLANVVLDKAVSAALSDEAIKAAFDEKYANAAPGSEFHAAHILVKTKEEADKIKADLDGGADFAEIAKASSTDPGSAASGGDLGWFGQGMMVEPFEKAVAALKPGETSGPVETQFGFHIIRLIETRSAEAPKLEDKRDEIAAELQQKAVENAVNGLMDKAQIAKMVDGVDPAVLKNGDLIGQ